MKGEYAISGEEAIGKVERAHHLNDDYFAVILDLKMPGMDGIETATRIRKVVGRDIPIIILSAYDCPHFEEIAQRAGVDGFISKPLMKSKLFYLMKSFAIKQEEKEEETEKPQYPFGNFEGKRILLVEDNSLNREIATVLLEETGAVVEEAENGLVAVNMVKTLVRDIMTWYYGYPDAGHERVRLYSPYSGIRTSGYQVHADNSHVCERICGRHQVV